MVPGTVVFTILYEHLQYRKQGVERRISHMMNMSSLASLTRSQLKHFSKSVRIVVSKQRLRTGMKTYFSNPND